MKKRTMLSATLAVWMTAAAGLAGAQSAVDALGPNGETISSTGPGSSSGSVEPNSPLARSTFGADGSSARPEDMVSAAPATPAPTYGTPAEQPAGSWQQPAAPATPYEQAPPAAPMIEPTTPAPGTEGPITPNTEPAPMR
ncbi:hypothetical protein OOT46_13630 [Aquabacterium sp. A7-Y]|uniref:hypothetical protein n=1 Tax=Aquabacterium sp. A7-Y TaxID=1349605 RepID=UPI00223CE407|nr:hypothetical protein [Aquabacterium sp. A7-Y]MCW7538881.1 hypothetical protein [Aquabacterium sp. A7-Y]